MSRVELGWNAVYDVCSVKTEDGPMLVMCSWKDDSVVGVGLHGGKKISWFDMWFNIVKPRFLFKTVDICEGH